jgi:hypothetical protein
VLNTDDITDLNDQIRIIQSAKKIIVTDGSPFLVNGLFLSNCEVYVIDNFTTTQMKIYNKLKTIIEKINILNRVKHIDHINPYLTPLV